MSMAHLASPAGEVWDELAVGMLLCDGRGRVRAVTGCAARLLGLTDDEVSRPSGWGLADDLGVPLPDLPVIAAQVLRAGTAATLPVVAGRRRLWLEVYPVATVALAVLRPVHNDVLRDKGLFDPVTGLPNRVLLFDRLDQALRRARVRGTTVTLVLVALPDERRLHETGALLVTGLDADHTVARYGVGTVAVVADGDVDIARRVAGLVTRPVRVGWATSDGTHSVHDVVSRAEAAVLA
ncbi:GGDEF domain-containing protein [Actinophytocola sp. NPDC049390]|uniref:GGDEF domain-containing protein n=1 Tax=Actinophytocola sp. NPDC049390 TaxID=3363894 RepID=UPI00379C1EDC